MSVSRRVTTPDPLKEFSYSSVQGEFKKHVFYNGQSNKTYICCQCEAKAFVSHWKQIYVVVNEIPTNALNSYTSLY
jgi:hypothetical protein